jgi:uroporphyrinogen decarboxylase
MRRFVFPWHKRIVAAAHAAGRPAILHSCGNLSLVMDDVIDDMKFDGKHSYEDAIQPVEEAYEQYGRRIAVLGGIDVDFVCRAASEEIHRRSKAMLERSAKRGGYALGTGNSVPAYVPDEGYFAMISAALEGRE